MLKYGPIYIYGNMCIYTYIHSSEKLGISSDHFKLVVFIFFFILFSILFHCYLYDLFLIEYNSDTTSSKEYVLIVLTVLRRES